MLFVVCVCVCTFVHACMCLRVCHSITIFLPFSLPLSPSLPPPPSLSPSQELMVEIFSTTAMSLDTTYTAKTVRGLLAELQSSPDRFQGRKILFIHTGQPPSLSETSITSVSTTRNAHAHAHIFPRQLWRRVYARAGCGSNLRA